MDANWRTTGYLIKWALVGPGQPSNRAAFCLGFPSGFVHIGQNELWAREWTFTRDDLTEALVTGSLFNCGTDQGDTDDDHPCDISFFFGFEFEDPNGAKYKRYSQALSLRLFKGHSADASQNVQLHVDPPYPNPDWDHVTPP